MLKKILSQIKQIIYPGLSISYKQLILLKKIAGKNKTIVEIGSYLDGTARVLGKYNTVYAIDPFIFYGRSDSSSLNIKEHRKEVIYKFLKNIHKRNVIWIEKNRKRL